MLDQQRLPTIDQPLGVRRRLWRWPFFQSYVVVFVGYMAMYLVRKNFNVAQVDLIETYGLSKTQLGMIGIAFSVCYGIGKTAVSYFVDGKNTKQIVPVMLMLSAVSMLGFAGALGGTSIALALMMGFYGFSGLCQASGGPSSYSTVTKWTPRKYRGTWLGLWNLSHNVGGALAASVALFGAHYLFNGHVVGMFVFPAMVALAIGAAGLFFGNDSPEAYGLGTAEEIFEETVSEEDQAAEEAALTKPQLFVRYVLKNPAIWLLCFANVFLYTVRIGIDQWSTVYAVQELGLTKEVAIRGFTFFEVGALVGTLAWGGISDLVGGRRGLVACAALGLIFAALGFYQRAGSDVVYLGALFTLGFLVFGPQLLIGVSGVGFVPKKAVSVADGVKGTFGYLLGDGFAKLGLGMIADGNALFGFQGWRGTFAVLHGAVLTCLVLMAMVAVLEERKIRKVRAGAES
ncbi:MAG: hexose-6-phosphate:phosphate antiporter [Deltaproteobacteria bacterium]|nr:hexose-6-phosphate:phosphate antiporter [Deltaproteobacteria bacterium]MBW2536270.1 hexose-6-phosphate:phosphate antiporter [Deltaproteobacteria bacterium]